MTRRSRPWIDHAQLFRAEAPASHVIDKWTGGNTFWAASARGSLQLNFKRFKDRIWGTYNRCARATASAPVPLGRGAFAALGRLLWLAYMAPGNPLRPTMRALSDMIGAGPPRRLFSRFAQGLTLGLYRMERLRLGHESEIDDLLEIPEPERLERLLLNGGVILVMPHAHGSLPMVRGLSRHYSVLMLVKTTRDEVRAASQQTYYARMGCQILDVRRTSDALVARGVIKAIREGMIVVVTGDLIREPPSGAIDKERDLVRATAFGQPLGAPGWPARFALKAGAPLVPVMAEQTDDRIVLHLGQPSEGPDIVSATCDWVRQLEGFFRSYPSDWTFVFDRRWSQLIRKAADERRP